MVKTSQARDTRDLPLVAVFAGVIAALGLFPAISAVWRSGADHRPAPVRIGWGLLANLVGGVLALNVLGILGLVLRADLSVAGAASAALVLVLGDVVKAMRSRTYRSSSKAEQGGAPVFAYECSWRTPCFDGMWSIHGVERPFVFKRPTYGVAWDGEDSDDTRAAAEPDGHRFQVGAQMFDAWINFAQTGNPSTDSLTWPPMRRPHV